MHLTYTPEAQIFVGFAHSTDENLFFFNLRPFFRKNAPNDRMWPWRVQGQKYQYACDIHSRGPNFCLFRSTMSRFRVTAQFWEKYIERPQKMTLISSRPTIHICILHTSPSPTFLSISLYDGPFFIYAPTKKGTEWPQMTLTYSRQKYQYACYIHPWSPYFSPLPYTLSRFRVTAQVWEKYTKWPKNDLDIFKVKCTHMHSTYIPEAHVFVHFALWWAVFDLRPFIRKDCTEWPQMTLTCSR